MAGLAHRLKQIRPVRRVMDHCAERLGYVRTSNANNLRLTDMSREFLELYDECKEFTGTSVERMFALYEATRYIAANRIAGDFVECGVYRGGSVMMMARSLLSLGITDRTLWLFDTFEGMTEPGSRDVSAEGADGHAQWSALQRDGYNAWVYSPLGDVQRNMLSTGYPAERVRFIKGKVEETLPAEAPAQIALLRLDTDWFESTYHELTHLYPRLVEHGILVVDDYGHWRGAREAVDGYFAQSGYQPLLARIDYTGRIVVKALMDHSLARVSSGVNGVKLVGETRQSVPR
jgi:O-methyltransferase